MQDTAWVRVFGDTAFQSGWMARQTRDAGFILTGQTCTYDYMGDVLLIKTDSNGIKQWEQHYGGTGYDIATAMDTCYDGGIIMGGGTLSYGTGAGTYFGNAYAIKVDSAGNQLWKKAIGDVYDDGFWNCFQSRDSNYVFAGYYTFSDPFYPTSCCFSNSKPYIVKLDTAGNILWQKTYGDIGSQNEINSIKELPNGDIIAAGLVSYYSLPYDQYRGVIIKINSSGDSLWYRTYTGLPGNASDSYLYDIAQTNNGGFVATGIVYPKPPDTGSQDIWVLKVDSNGCEVANCLISSTGEIISGYTNNFTVYPNPSQNIFHFAFSNDGDEIKQIEITNMLGKKIMLATHNEIDLTNYANGIYFYTAQTKKGRVFNGKIIKE